MNDKAYPLQINENEQQNKYHCAYCHKKLVDPYLYAHRYFHKKCIVYLLDKLGLKVSTDGSITT